MYKKIIMETEFEAIPMTGISLEEYLEKNLGYVDIGGFEIMHPKYKHEIPFDFEATAFSIRGYDSYAFGNWDGLGCRILDVDPCYCEEWAKNGLSKNEITAKLLAEALEITEFYFCLSENVFDREIPVFLKVKDVRFTDELDNCHEIKKEVLADYNKRRVAQMTAEFLNSKEKDPFNAEQLKEDVDICLTILNDKNPNDLLDTIQTVNAYRNDDTNSRKMVDFLIDSMMQVANARDQIYRVGLLACGNIDHGMDPYMPLPGIEPHYFYAASILDCQRAVRNFIEEHNLGAGEWSGGLTYQGNRYIGGISYNGRFWDSSDSHYNLCQLTKTDLLTMDKRLQKNMPMFERDVKAQIAAAIKIDKSLKEQIINASKEHKTQAKKDHPSKDKER